MSKDYRPHRLYGHAGNPGSLADGDLWVDTTNGHVKCQVSSGVGNLNFGNMFADITSGSYYYMPGRVYNSATSGVAITRDRVFYLPFSVSKACTLTSYNLWVETGGASSNVLRAGLWEGTAGKPGTLLADWGTKVSTTTGQKQWTPATALDPSIQYWIGVASQVGTTCTVTTGAYHQPLFFPQDSGTAPTNLNAFQQTAVFGYFRQDSVTGAFSNAGTLLRDGAACPIGIIQLT